MARIRNYQYNKYGNGACYVDGIRFDSKREGRRYRELSLLEKAGEIKDLQRQVRYVLIPQQREPDTVGVRGGIKKGKVIEQECAYVADFVYYTSDGLLVVEDTKGMRTRDYIIKRKLMLHKYGIRIHEI